MTAFVQLGKFGDLLNMLPLALHHWKVSGENPHLISSRQYGSILDRANYVQPVFYDGDWDDLEGAIKFAKQNFDNVIVTQTYGRTVPIAKTRSSFQLEAWHRARSLHLWDTLPLVLDRNPQDERKLLKDLGATGKSFCLIADHSQSSPFFQKQELYELVESTMLLQDVPCKAIRLSEIRLPHLCDFLPLFDAARFIVAVESAHLHLTRATNTPVMALAADKPSAWHGSAWSKRFAFYCRYAEFSSRKPELVSAIDDVMAGRDKSIQRLI